MCCLREGCKKHVAEVVGRAARPYRVSADGRRWRDFCSKSCCAYVVGIRQRGRQEAAEAFLENNRDAYRSRVKQRLHDEAEPIARQYGIPVGELVRALWRAEHRGYQRGFAAAWAQRRRRAIS